MPAVLIAGSAGLIGSEAAQFYCERGHLVVGHRQRHAQPLLRRGRLHALEARRPRARLCGSRFSYESVLINYPFVKILCNRVFHWLVKLTLIRRVRDIYDIEEVPVSWINRTVDMGASSLRVIRVAPGYFWGLMRPIVRVWRGQRDFSRPLADLPPASESVDAAR